MSLFSKVIARAAIPGQPSIPTAQPKGAALTLRRAEADEEMAEPLRRQEDEMQTLRRTASKEEDTTAQALRRQETDEEEMQPLRRAEMSEEAEDAQALRRQDDNEEEMQRLRRSELDEEDAQPVRRTELADEEAQALRRQEEEEDAQPMRRTETGEEPEDAQALRRQEEEEEMQPLRRTELGEEPEEAQALRRQEQEEEADMQLMRMENPELPEEPNAAQAMRRAEAASLSVDSAPDIRAGESGVIETNSPQDVFEPASRPPVTSPFDRPRVQIDQIDVTIHEPTPSQSRSGQDAGAELSRMLSGRYLRGF
ncbi:MAG: hypothetical protein ABJM43_16225 [Paracoccaceae bacterium]